MAEIEENEGRTTASTADPQEIEKFSALAEDWWDPDGQFAPLHRLNPVRLTYVRDRLAAQFGRDPLQPRPLEGLSLLDIGCGGGLLSEPLTRLGARVTGLDASATSVEVAKRHAAQSGLEIVYRQGTAEDLAAAGERFDAVVSLEVVEHVADLETFLGAAVTLTRPGGALVLATLNRTPKSFLLAIVGAEYLLRWLPRGTHDWRRFVRPSELAAGLRRHGAAVTDMIGVAYNPLSDDWRLSRDLEVNYMLAAIRSAEETRA